MCPFLYLTMSGTKPNILMKSNTVFQRETYSIEARELLRLRKRSITNRVIMLDSKKLISGLVDLWWELFAVLLGLVYLVAWLESGVMARVRVTLDETNVPWL